MQNNERSANNRKDKTEELYVEFKSCSLTCVDKNEIVNERIYYIYFMNDTSIAQIVNKKSIDEVFTITDDYKYIYAMYNGTPNLYRIINISRKPIVRHVDKIELWMKYEKRINELKQIRRKLLYE